MYDCLVCGNGSKECDHYAYAKLGYLFYHARMFVNSWSWDNLYSALAQRQLVLGELRIGNSKGNYLLTLTAKGKRFVIDNASKVIKELARGTFGEFAVQELAEQGICVEFMNAYITLEELPQFLTSDSLFLRSIAEQRFLDLEVELEARYK